MKFVKKNIFVSSTLSIVTLIGAQFAFNGQAHAWQHLDARYKICNDFDWPLQVVKTGNYQMDTNNDHSADQTIQPHTCSAIDFWALHQGSGYDLDDAMDFQVNDSNGKAGVFTIKVVDYWTLILRFKIVNYSGFIFETKSANTLQTEITEGEIHFH